MTSRSHLASPSDLRRSSTRVQPSIHRLIRCPCYQPHVADNSGTVSSLVVDLTWFPFASTQIHQFASPHLNPLKTKPQPHSPCRSRNTLAPFFNPLYIPRFTLERSYTYLTIHRLVRSMFITVLPSLFDVILDCPFWILSCPQPPLRAIYCMYQKIGK